MRTFVPRQSYILKTDLWNEGIEVGRDLLSSLSRTTRDATIVGSDVSKYVCDSAHGNSNFAIVRTTLLASAFRPVFDLIIDPSTIDHMPERLREEWISAEAAALKERGILIVSFDCRLNLFTELYHRFFTRRVYPEWTLLPSTIRHQLEQRGFQIIREHAFFIPGLFFGTHKPWFPLSRFFSNGRVLEMLKKLELSSRSRFLSFLAPQYVMVAQKTEITENMRLDQRHLDAGSNPR